MRLSVILLAFAISASSVAERSVAEQDSLALVAFYEATIGDQWIRNDNWLSGAVTEWYGVVVKDQQVNSLVLSANNLSGQLPEELGDLSNLQHLFISYNAISGEIPASIGELNLLQMLWAQYNSFSGSLPESIGKLDSLKTLNLSQNTLKGALPKGIGNLKALENLNLQFNSLDNSLPDTIGNLMNLKYLFLNNNKFSGEVPVSLQMMSKLCMASFKDNFFTDFPDLSGIAPLHVNLGVPGLDVQNNRLDFVDIAPNMVLFSAEAKYAPQRVFSTGLDIVVRPGDTLAFDMPGQTIINTTDTNAVYTYKKNGKLVQDGHLTIYDVKPATLAHLGTYTCTSTHADVPGLVLQMGTVQLRSMQDSTWLSLGTYLDGNLVDTVPYDLELYKKDGEIYERSTLKPLIRGGKCEMMIAEGDYFIKVIPQDTLLMIRYCKNTNQWQEKSISKAIAGSSLSFSSHFMREKTMTGGAQFSGTINKAISASVEKSFSITEGVEGDVFAGADVYLYDASLLKYLLHSRSNASGAFVFNKLDAGTYLVIIDYPGYTMEREFSVSLSDGSGAVERKSYSLVDSVSSNVGLEEMNTIENEVMVYPNPTSGMIFVKGTFVEGKTLQYNLFDLNGREMVSEYIESYAKIAGIELNRNELKAGMYILELYNGEERVSKRIMIR